ncbi:MAG: UPF0175 family protein [Nitrospirae bacterium]|nr:UPF0175 family protein [Nitrospirota bacterium]
MKTLKVGEDLYKELQEVARMQGVRVRELLPKALEQGVMVLKEDPVLDLYRKRETSLQRAAGLLSVDLWTMLEKLKKADIHLDYTFEELHEDVPV